MTSCVRGIVFDKDGTLFDFDRTWGPVTGELIARECERDARKMSELAAVLGYDLERCRFFPESIVIASTSEVVEAAVLPFTKDGDVDALRQRMRDATGGVAQIAVGDLSAIFGQLRRQGLKLGIATNDAAAPARANLEGAGVLGAFDFVAGFDSGFGSKPAPGQLHAFCEEVGLAPAECVMVGDSLHDIHAGKAAGMSTVGVLTGPAPREELATHADVVLESIVDLPAWLENT